MADNRNADYLPRNAIEKFIENGLNNPNRDKAFGYDAIEILAEVHYMPAADVVEVTRCKDCEFSRELSKTEKRIWLDECRACESTEASQNGYMIVPPQNIFAATENGRRLCRANHNTDITAETPGREVPGVQCLQHVLCGESPRSGEGTSGRHFRRRNRLRLYVPLPCLRRERLSAK